MSKPHVFRPQVSEVLEARAVPSLAGVTLATGIHGISVTLPQQVSSSNPQVQAAFTAFDQGYIRAVDTLLATTGSNGLIVSPSGRAAFVASIEESLATFARQLVASLNTSTTTGPASTHSTVANQVVSAILGGGSTSLESQILSLSIERIEGQVSVTTTTSAASTQALVPVVVGTAEQVRPTTVVPVAESGGPATSDLASSTSSSSSSTKPAEAVRSAFGAFLNDYFRAVQGTLIAAGPDGQVDPSSNRAAFDARVGVAIRSLESTLTASLARYPATSALGPQIRSAIEGEGPSSLKAQLAGLATPQGAQATVVRSFTLGSTRAIAQALAAITGDVARLIGPAGP